MESESLKEINPNLPLEEKQKLIEGQKEPRGQSIVLTFEEIKQLGERKKIPSVSNIKSGASFLKGVVDGENFPKPNYIPDLNQNRLPPRRGIEPITSKTETPVSPVEQISLEFTHEVEEGDSLWKVLEETLEK